MNPNGRKAVLHMIDGQPMTTVQIAQMLGTSKHALEIRRSNLGGCSYQVIVNLYRENQWAPGDKKPRHNIHGRWLTTAQIAEECGVSTHRMCAWRYSMTRHGQRPTMEQAYDHYMRYKRGEAIRYPGSVARRHRVQGHLMTVAEAAQKYHTSENALRSTMTKRSCALDTAVRRLEARRKKKAERAIMDILRGK